MLAVLLIAAGANVITLRLRRMNKVLRAGHQGSVVATMSEMQKAENAVVNTR